MDIPDISKIPWQLSIAIIGAAFSVFALIYNETYIFLGMITFLYGVIAHWVDLVFWKAIVKKGEENLKHPTIFIIHSILMIIWIIILISIAHF